MKSDSEVLAPIPEPFRSALISTYAGEPQLGSDDAKHPVDGITKIGSRQGLWLYNLCCEKKPARILEIGLGFGYSTVYFLAAIRENGFGQLTAIDPFQHQWHGIGARRAELLGMAESFRLIEKRSAAALVELAGAGDAFDVIFIDGDHHFDAALLDFTLSAELSPPGGYVVFDDLWMPSVRRVASFVRANRKDFKEISNNVGNIAAFRRCGCDSRDWEHFEEFGGPGAPLVQLANSSVGLLRRIARLLRARRRR